MHGTRFLPFTGKVQYEALSNRSLNYGGVVGLQNHWYYTYVVISSLSNLNYKIAFETSKLQENYHKTHGNSDSKTF